VSSPALIAAINRAVCGRGEDGPCPLGIVSERRRTVGRRAECRHRSGTRACRQQRFAVLRHRHRTRSGTLRRHRHPALRFEVGIQREMRDRRALAVGVVRQVQMPAVGCQRHGRWANRCRTRARCHRILELSLRGHSVGRQVPGSPVGDVQPPVVASRWCSMQTSGKRMAPALRKPLTEALTSSAREAEWTASAQLGGRGRPVGTLTRRGSRGLVGRLSLSRWG
jgi:hypothetical protein